MRGQAAAAFTADDAPQAGARAPNVSRATFLAFMDEYADVDAGVRESVGKRKDLRARIVGAGFKIGPFDRCRKEADKSGEKREEEDREYRRDMGWLGKPVGVYYVRANGADGAEGEEEDDDEPAAAVSEHQLRQIEAGGFAAGKSGHARVVNPWTPGTLSYQVYDEAWIRGADALAAAKVKEAPPPARVVAVPGAPRRRGRPPGSKNRPKTNGANGDEEAA